MSPPAKNAFEGAQPACCTRGVVMGHPGYSSGAEGRCCCGLKERKTTLARGPEPGDRAGDRRSW